MGSELVPNFWLKKEKREGGDWHLPTEKTKREGKKNTKGELFKKANPN